MRRCHRPMDFCVDGVGWSAPEILKTLQPPTRLDHGWQPAKGGPHGTYQIRISLILNIILYRISNSYVTLRAVPIADARSSAAA